LDIIGSTRKKGIYVISSPQAVIEIKERVKIAILLDIEADINIITVKIADATNLPILEIISLEAETFTSYNA
jgi:hypothetical protein